jgi:hypothetical protein
MLVLNSLSKKCFSANWHLVYVTLARQTIIRPVTEYFASIGRNEPSFVI